MGTASAKVFNARVSFKDSMILINELKRMKSEKAKKFLQDLIDEKVNIECKYFTKASKKFLELLNTAEANSKQKNLNLEKLFIKAIKVNKGEKFVRPKSRFKYRGREAKSTNIEIVLEER